MKNSTSELETLRIAANKNFVGKLGIYAKLSGPGWIQAAVTLGGGSLVSALYLGVIGGYQFMWLQPLAMLLGIIMLGAISHVTLSSEERPFVSVKKNISPSLAWGWLIATVIADVVFCSAQYSLGTDAVQGNLGLFKGEGGTVYIITGIFTVISLSLLWMSLQGGKASKVIDYVIKGLVAVVVLSFMGVVIVLAANGGVAWGALLKGIVPDFSALFRPTSTYAEAISATGESAAFWKEYITSNQRNVIISAFGAAVGINMTFLLPYSLKAKGWSKPHRELSRFDLVLGLFVPFIMATSFLVIATSSQFHANKDGMHSPAAAASVLDARLASTVEDYKSLPEEQQSELRNALPQAEKDISVMLAKRNARDLATSLEPFLGKNAQLIFGIGILAMAISTMIVHMMMNGYAISEALGKPGKKALFMFGAAMPAAAGFFSPILWQGDPTIKTAIAVPAGVMAATLLPIAYLVFVLLMNSKKTLGSEMPKRRGLINTLMIIATTVATFASIWSLLGKLDSTKAYEQIFGIVGLIGLPILFFIGILGFIKKNRAL